MKHQHIVLSLSGKRLHFCVQYVLLFLLIFPTVLLCVTMQGSNLPVNNSDFTKSKADSLKQKLLLDYRSYKLKKQTGLLSGNWLDTNSGYMLGLRYSDITDNDFVKLTKELYSNYYMKKIELYNFKGYAYIYLDIKQAQSNKGAFQISIPLSNFIEILRSKKTKLED